MKKITTISLCIAMLVLTGCAQVHVVKTAKGFYSPTDADSVDILVTVPNKTTQDFIEVATVTTTHWDTNETAKMHNSLRAKAAPLGANAVILINSGIDYNGYYWSSGVAIRYK
jgi:hypothetical protein